MFEHAAFESAAFEALMDIAEGSALSWSGEATMEVVGTTSHIALIESGEGLMAFSAEIHLRSL